MFEVTKAEEGAQGSGSGQGGSMSPIQNMRNNSALKVTVPAELDGSAYIFVCIKKGKSNCYFLKYKVPINDRPSSSE